MTSIIWLLLLCLIGKLFCPMFLFCHSLFKGFWKIASGKFILRRSTLSHLQVHQWMMHSTLTGISMHTFWSCRQSRTQQPEPKRAIICSCADEWIFQSSSYHDLQSKEFFCCNWNLQWESSHQDEFTGALGSINQSAWIHESIKSIYQDDGPLSGCQTLTPNVLLCHLHQAETVAWNMFNWEHSNCSSRASHEDVPGLAQCFFRLVEAM